ncbi:MAG: hypothetical protein H0W87_10390 [Actinobacteria bacterium]|nr:hypothetical protein [Actinomycetota bacterium]
MDVRRLAPGLWRWTARHPEAAGWPQDAADGLPWPDLVGCVYYEASDAVCLIDPLLPGGEEDEFLAHLDRDVERLELPVVILLTAEWHRRSSDVLAQRYGATITIGESLPAGIEAHSIEGADEVQLAYFIRPHRALVVAEVFGVDSSGTLGVYPSPGLIDRAALDKSLQSLLELQVERLLVSHGEPVLEDGRAAMELALRQSLPAQPED